MFRQSQSMDFLPIFLFQYSSSALLASLNPFLVLEIHSRNTLSLQCFLSLKKTSCVEWDSKPLAKNGFPNTTKSYGGALSYNIRVIINTVYGNGNKSNFAP